MFKYKKSIFRFSILVFVFALFLFTGMSFKDYFVFDSLVVNINNKDVMYGNTIKLEDLVKTSNSYKVIKNVNTKQLGEQEVVLQVKKEGVTKIVPAKINVIDNTKPNISVKSNKVTIKYGDKYDINSNIKVVLDDSENLVYKAKPSSNDRGYYTISSNFNNKKSGSYDVKITAVDRANNVSVYTYKINVKEKPVEVKDTVINFRENAEKNAASGDIVSIAYSLVGSPYRSGGNSPSGFDCSGFVQYVYGQAGKSISRSSGTQAGEGVGISYKNAQPGDILSWGHGGRVTHSAIYIGNGKMIHAANYGTGVIVSNVSRWDRGSSDNIISVRRVS